VVACASTQRGRQAPAIGPSSEGRIAPWSVADPPSEVPASANIGATQAPVQSLAPPLPNRQALELLHAFFRAITDENLDELAAVTSSDATVPGKNRGPSSAMLDHWRGRMSHLRYQALASETLFDEARIESYRFQDWDGDAVAYRFERPSEMMPSDLLIRVPMQIVQSGSERVFGDVMMLLMRAHQGRLAIVQQLEDFVVQ
jgi:hypothetical protein